MQSFGPCQKHLTELPLTWKIVCLLIIISHWHFQSGGSSYNIFSNIICPHIRIPSLGLSSSPLFDTMCCVTCAFDINLVR
jgi:hypothetical protein